MYGSQQFVQIDGFRKVIDGSHFHGIHRITYIGESSNNEKGQVRMYFADISKQVNAAGSGHADIGHDQDWNICRYDLQCGFRRCSGTG